MAKAGVLVQQYNYKKDKALPLKGGRVLKENILLSQSVFWIRIRIYQILWIHIIALNAKKLKCMRSRSQGASFLLITQALIIVFRGDAPQ